MYKMHTVINVYEVGLHLGTLENKAALFSDPFQFARFKFCHRIMFNISFIRFKLKALQHFSEHSGLIF